MAAEINKMVKEENDKEENFVKLIPPQAGPRKYEYVYRNMIIFTYYHLAALYGIYCLFYAKWETLFYTYIVYMLTVLGLTAGTHRLWSHKAYKAKPLLQVFLMLCQSMSNQHTISHWVRDHRLHHKYSDTDADPHNATRGLFYSHIGWLFVRKHAEVKKRGKTIDMSDIKQNPVLQFQEKHAAWLLPTAAFIIPTIIPLLWNEDLSISYHLSLVRIVMNMNMTFLVNSAAHAFGSKPYDKTIVPTQSIPVCLLTLGEGYHNYHHTFPSDYRASELGNNYWNYSTLFIDLCEKMGLAYDLRSASRDVVEKRMNRTGDGSDLWCREIKKAL